MSIEVNLYEWRTILLAAGREWRRSGVAQQRPSAVGGDAGRLGKEFVYLAVVLDAFSRRVVGWAMASYMLASLALSALEMALRHRYGTAGGLVHHSDHYSQCAVRSPTAATNGDPPHLRCADPAPPADQVGGS